MSPHSIGLKSSQLRRLSILAGLIFALATSCVARAQVEINSEKIQIVFSQTNLKNQLNISTTFTNDGDPGCFLDDAIADGIVVLPISGTCSVGAVILLPLFFDPHTIGHQSFGTFYDADPGFFTESARITALPTPSGTCGQWTLNLEGSGAGFTEIFSVESPVALLIFDADGDEGCVDVPAKNVIIGNSTR